MAFIMYLSFQSFGQDYDPRWTVSEKQAEAAQDWSVQPSEFVKAILSFDDFYRSILENNGDINIIILPDSEGKLNAFAVSHQPVFEENLRAKYPGFYSYFGTQINNRENVIALGISPFGMSAMIMENNGNTYYIDPIRLHDKNEYLIYKKRDLSKHAKIKWFCKPPDVSDEIYDEDITRYKSNISHERAGDCRLRTYRLALACTGEYGTFHGGTKERVLQAYQTAVTRINAVYRKEIGIFFRLVDNTDQLIFFNSSTDPYTNNDSGAMLSQNQTTVDQIIGRANYDIGHVFGTGDGGIASLGSVCSSNRKAQGVTGRPNPVGDGFFIDYVAHEIGHQFRANHTQNNNCQRNGPTAVEPGSGSTIMGYAGICMPNVQNNSHDYFHTISLSEISSFILNQPACGVTENFSNSRPGLTVPKNSYTIPVSTSFLLTATGNDNDENDMLTYTWEQMNNEITQMPPRANSTAGPMFRSIPPSSSPTRYLPDLKNKFGQWEVTPSVSRTMNFRCTVRDNSDLGGCTTELNVVVNTSASAGPFMVTQPNTPSVIWEAGQSATVTWDVANTNLAPVDSQVADIFLSLDGGTSYPVRLASGVPNTGSADITVPNAPTSAARVMVASADNIFFDYSNFSFTIKSSLLIEKEEKTKEICGEEVLFPIKISSLQNNIDHELSFEKVLSPPGVTIIFPRDVASLPFIDTIVIKFAFTLPAGIYPIIYKITDGPYTIFDTLHVLSRGGIHHSLPLIQPSDGMQFSAGQNVILLQWQNDIAEKYELQISTTPAFNETNTEKFILTSDRYPFSAGNNIYFWRVKAFSDCIELPWSEVFIFSKGSKPKRDVPLLRLNPLVVEKSGRDTIKPVNLSIDYEEVLPFNYRIIEKPRYGNLIKYDNTNIDTLSEGDYFTSEDIIQNKLQYQHEGQDSLRDGFSFMIENQAVWGGSYHFDIFIIPRQVFSAFLEVDSDILCNGEKAMLMLRVNNGVSPFSVAKSGENVFTPLQSFNIAVNDGIYAFIIRDNNQQEIITNTIHVSSPPLLTNDSRLVNYDLQILTSGGAGITREFSIDGINYFHDFTFPDIGNGTRVTYVKDINECIAQDTVSLQISSLTIDSLLYQDSLPCFRDETTLVPFISGGIPPYRLFLNDTLLEVFPMTIQPGQYNFSVIDEGNKMVQTAVAVFSPEDIEPNITVERRDVFWQPSGGAPPYEYSFDGVQFSSQDFALDLANDEYTLIVRDNNQCLISESFIISILETIGIRVDPPNCHGETGSITISPENGTPPFRFGLNKSELDSLTLLPDLPAGNYVLFVIDATGDTIEQAFQIVQPDSLQLSFEIRSDTLIIIAEGGTPPYLYSVDGGFTYLTPDTFYNVPKGIYQILVKDANDCFDAGEVEITYSSTENSGFESFVTLYPNPTTGRVWVRSGKPDLSKYKLILRDGSGREIFTDQKIQGGHSAELNFEGLSPGIYFLHLRDPLTSMAIKIVKL